MLANSCVRQNFESIELYFVFYFRMDCGCATVRVEQKKREDRTKQGKTPCPIDRRADMRQLFACPIDRMAAEFRESHLNRYGFVFF